MTPRELSDLMHKYLEATFAPIHKHGGLVIELKGDSILALWKGNSDDLSLRRNACAGALEVAEAVRRFNQSNQVVNLPTRISIHAGAIFLGNIGAGAHYEYGATGDTITTASRLDGLNKHLGTNILVSAEVIRDLDDFLSSRSWYISCERQNSTGRGLRIDLSRGRMHRRQKDSMRDFCRGAAGFRTTSLG